MRRSRANRRKVTRAPLKLPRIRIQLRWFVFPPAAVATLAGVYLGAQAALSLPIKRLRIDGVFERVTPLQVEGAVAGSLDGGFLAVSLHGVQRAVESLPWVDRAELTRIWPDTLAIEIVEQQAAARWGEQGLLNVRGELFSNERHFSLPELPALSGPPGSEHEVASRYLMLRDELAAAGLVLRGLTMDDRGAWTIELGGGQQIRLGKEDVEPRLQRLFRFALPALADRLDRVDYVDMRYTNGFAVAWIGPVELSRAAVAAGQGSG